MTRFFSASFVCATVALSPAMAVEMQTNTSDLPRLAGQDYPYVLLASSDKGQGKAKGKDKQKAKSKSKPEKAQKAKGNGQAKQKKSAGAAAQPASQTDTKTVVVDKHTGTAVISLPDGFSSQAPEDRDMVDILRTGALIWANPDQFRDDADGRDVARYRNCPPGLAKKDPPCVPPGLAKKGVTTSEWLNYEETTLEGIIADRIADYVFDRDPTSRDRGLLGSDQIADLYGLSPAPRGQQYALIDGLPIRLDDDEYRALRQINTLADISGVEPSTSIVPNAALTQPELQLLYRLPDPGPGRNYAVLNGRLVALDDKEYDLLQLLRVSRAVL